MKLSDIQKLAKNIRLTEEELMRGSQMELIQKLGMEPGSFYQELEMDSRFVDTHQDTSWSNASVNLHSHSFFEILFCRNTCGAEYLVGSERYRLQKGDIVLVAPGVSHCPLLPEHMAEPYKRDVIWLSTEFMDFLIQTFPVLQNYHPLYSTLLRTADTNWESLGELFQNGVWEAKHKMPGWEVAVIGNTIHLLSLIFRAFMDKTTAHMKAEKPELLDRVLAFVETHLAEKITLGEIARHFYVSESTISQTFRQKMGVSFHRCVTQQRLIVAKTLISEGAPLEMVGQQVGFSDYSTFYRAFKQEYGINPRQYRKLQENTEPIL